MTSGRTREILAHLATRPGHDEVKADFRDLLIEEFGAHRHALRFEERVPEIRGRLDALIGSTILEAKRNLVTEWADVERRMPDYLADRERDTGERFVGIATDGLLSLVYGRNIEADTLWFQHTFLVVIAKAIALAVLALHEDDPARLLSGAAFRDVNIHGAVESDFFDWPLAAPEGHDLVRWVATHVSRFRLREVESDVLKVLYESLIDPGERHDLGEYYTPDWLAAKVVKHAVKHPLEELVLDPACGSGSFLFHALRLHLSEAEGSGMKPQDLAHEATLHVAGMDIHLVAAIIARVTYLLALAPALSTRGGRISIPVYLGDALQLEVSQFFTGKKLTVTVPPLPPRLRSCEPRFSGGFL